MIFRPNYCIAITLFFLSFNSLSAQKHERVSDSLNLKYVKFYEFRGTNSIDVSLGTSIVNGDLVDPIFEIYMHIGYKRFVLPYLNINFGYNKFNLAYKDVLNEGFMSFDLNLEALLFPNELFSPYIFVGGGLNAANYFDHTAAKVQGGIGVEYIVAEGFGIKLFSDYNHVFSDELDGKIFGEADDVYWRIAFGVNYYFGGKEKKQKILNDTPSVINSNPIIPNN